MQEGPDKEAAMRSIEALILRAVQNEKRDDSSELWELAARTLQELELDLQPLIQCLVSRVSESSKGPLQVGFQRLK